MCQSTQGARSHVETELNQRPYIIEMMHSYTLPICNAHLGCTYSYGHRLQCHLVAGIGAAQINITQAMYRSALSLNIRSLYIHKEGV